MCMHTAAQRKQVPAHGQHQGVGADRTGGQGQDSCGLFGDEAGAPAVRAHAQGGCLSFSLSFLHSTCISDLHP